MSKSSYPSTRLERDTAETPSIENVAIASQSGLLAGGRWRSARDDIQAKTVEIPSVRCDCA
ncbi:MAG TPA: hypothetical protein VKP30_33700 [Polyangiaceae bacterium]|nr:hypothetical protein [Polyangiaceae bacterium]